MGTDAMMELVFDGGDIQVYHADERFDKPGRYVWYKGRYMIAGDECPSCSAKDTRIKELEKAAEVAAKRPNKFGPHYMIWLDEMDAALSAAGRERDEIPHPLRSRGR